MYEHNATSMILNILLFGITRDIVGQPKLTYEVPSQSTVPTLLESLKQTYPALQDLSSMMVAVNNEYSKTSQVLHESDEVALIPPVSGG